MVVRVILIGLLCALVAPKAEAQAMAKGTNVITLGFGFDPYYKYAGSNGYNGYKRSGLGPILLTYERGITDILGIGRIGVGGGIAQSFYSSRWTTGNGYTEHVYKNSRTGIMVRAAYHFDFGIDQLDVYAGVGGAVYVNNYDEYARDLDGSYDYKSKRTNVGGGPNVFGGVRYYFGQTFGVYGEVGYGTSMISGGIAFKF